MRTVFLCHVKTDLSKAITKELQLTWEMVAYIEYVRITLKIVTKMKIKLHYFAEKVCNHIHMHMSTYYSDVFL